MDRDRLEFYTDIKRDTLVEELIEAHPDAVDWLAEKDIVCIVCGEPYWGPLEDLVKGAGKDPDEVVEELRTYLAEREKSE